MVAADCNKIVRRHHLLDVLDHHYPSIALTRDPPFHIVFLDDIQDVTTLFFSIVQSIYTVIATDHLSLALHMP